MAASLIFLSGQQVSAFSDQVVGVYRRAFREPPYNRTKGEVIAFANSLPGHISREGFRFLGLFEGESKSMLGFSYGYTTRPGQWWHDQVTKALKYQTSKEWLDHSFQLVELAVSPEVQGRGYGSRLHDGLIAGLPHQRAVLSTLAKETVAYHLYKNRGWADLLQGFQFSGATRPYRIMGLVLNARV
jgi:ribosomal protein S18 acetylase RimI-like enzyme